MIHLRQLPGLGHKRMGDGSVMAQSKPTELQNNGLKGLEPCETSPKQNPPNGHPASPASKARKRPNSYGLMRPSADIYCKNPRKCLVCRVFKPLPAELIYARARQNPSLCVYLQGTSHWIEPSFADIDSLQTAARIRLQTWPGQPLSLFPMLNAESDPSATLKKNGWGALNQPTQEIPDPQACDPPQARGHWLGLARVPRLDRAM